LYALVKIIHYPVEGFAAARLRPVPLGVN